MYYDLFNDYLKKNNLKNSTSTFAEGLDKYQININNVLPLSINNEAELLAFISNK